MSDQSMWDNPLVSRAKEVLSKDDIERMKKKGEDFYSMDFEKNDTSSTDAVGEVLQQLTAMLKSGMHPSFFSKEEKNFLKINIGEKWYEEFGYLENDLHRINM